MLAINSLWKCDLVIFSFFYYMDKQQITQNSTIR